MREGFPNAAKWENVGWRCIRVLPDRLGRRGGHQPGCPDCEGPFNQGPNQNSKGWARPPARAEVTLCSFLGSVRAWALLRTNWLGRRESVVESLSGGLEKDRDRIADPVTMVR